MKGMIVKPICLRNSLYLLIPFEVAKVTGITKDTKFVLKLVHGNQTILKFEKVKDDSIDLDKLSLAKIASYR
jgi:hypothetical protein